MDEPYEPRVWRDGMRQCPQAAEVLRSFAAAMHGPVPRRSFAHLLRMMTAVTANAEPDVFNDSEIADASAQFATALTRQLTAAYQQATTQRRPRRPWLAALVPLVTLVNTLLLVWLLWQLSQATTAAAAAGWAWAVVGTLSLYGLASLVQDGRRSSKKGESR